MAQKGSPEQGDLALERELAQLKQEFEKLNTRKLQTEINLKNLEENLEDLRKEARESYGTDDPDELEKLLQEKREENARLVAEYRAHIQGIQESLGRVEEAE